MSEPYHSLGLRVTTAFWAAFIMAFNVKLKQLEGLQFKLAKLKF